MAKLGYGPNTGAVVGISGVGAGHQKITRKTGTPARNSVSTRSSTRKPKVNLETYPGIKNTSKGKLPKGSGAVTAGKPKNKNSVAKAKGKIRG